MTNQEPPLDHVAKPKQDQAFTESKWAGTSKSVISTTVMLVMVLAPMLGLDISEEDGVTLEKSLYSIAAAGFFLFGLFGRAQAKTKIFFWRR